MEYLAIHSLNLRATAAWRVAAPPMLRPGVAPRGITRGPAETSALFSCFDFVGTYAQALQLNMSTNSNIGMRPPHLVHNNNYAALEQENNNEATNYVGIQSLKQWFKYAFLMTTYLEHKDAYKNEIITGFPSPAFCCVLYSFSLIILSTSVSLRVKSNVLITFFG
jgi:hypothetical protein